MGVTQVISSFEIDDTPPKQPEISNIEILTAADNLDAIAEKDEKIRKLEGNN